MGESETRLDAIVIDDATWDGAAPERRREWQVVLEELLAEHRFARATVGRRRMLVTVQPDRIVWAARRADAGATDAADADPADAELVIELPLAAMEGHLREYFGICRDMGQLAVGSNSPQVEALDIAKRLVHDEAAETVQRHFVALAPDHATARRLFTLLVTLYFDTTQLVRPHHLDAVGTGPGKSTARNH